MKFQVFAVFRRILSESLIKKPKVCLTFIIIHIILGRILRGTLLNFSGVDNYRGTVWW